MNTAQGFLPHRDLPIFMSMHRGLLLAFAAGIILKLLHLPYHTVVLLVVVAFGLGAGIFALIGSDKPRGWCVLAGWSWLLHLVAVLKLFPFRPVTLILALSLTLVAGIVVLRQSAPVPAFRQLVGIGIVVLLVMAVPTSTRYFVTNLRFSLEQDADYMTWDKYSFFLLREGRTAEALTANQAAIEAAMRSHDEGTAALLQARQEAIEQGTWERYTPLGHGQ